MRVLAFESEVAAAKRRKANALLVEGAEGNSLGGWAIEKPFQ